MFTTALASLFSVKQFLKINFNAPNHVQFVLLLQPTCISTAGPRYLSELHQ